MTDQKMLALERAQRAHVALAQQRAAIRAAGRRGGALKAADLVLAGESPMRFITLLRAIPGIGDMRARQALGRARIYPETKLNSDLVGDHQRQLLAGQLVAHAKGSKRQ